MARIRTIKPDFWKDGRIARLTPACALFFIGLWNFCDDEGKCKADPFELSLSLPSFRSQDIVKHLSRLAEAGLIQLSTGTEWLLVKNWDHQKIDKPKKPKVSKSEIEWSHNLTESNSSNTLRRFVDRSENVRLKDSIVKDRIGEDGISLPDPSRKVSEVLEKEFESETVKKLRSDIEHCSEVFRETLRHFKQGRTLTPSESHRIGQAIQANSAKAVELALIGARYETKSEKFNPEDWVDLTRYLSPKNFTRLLGLGTRATNRVDAKALTITKSVVEIEPRSDNEELEAAEAREKISKLLSPFGKSGAA